MRWGCSRYRLTRTSPTRCRPGIRGETREQRIRELLVVAPELTVIGLPEGNWIQVTDGHATLGGPNPTLLFKAGEEAITLPAGYRF